MCFPFGMADSVFVARVGWAQFIKCEFRSYSLQQFQTFYLAADSVISLPLTTVLSLVFEKYIVFMKREEEGLKRTV